jgi:hypothetical protein
MDEVIKTDFHYQNHTETLTHVATQPTEEIILNRNAELRKNPGAIKDLSFGRQVASIPFIIYNNAIRQGFALNSRDKDIADREMMRFLKTPIGRTCMVQPTKEGSKNGI